MPPHPKANQRPSSHWMDLESRCIRDVWFSSFCWAGSDLWRRWMWFLHGVTLNCYSSVDDATGIASPTRHLHTKWRGEERYKIQLPQGLAHSGNWLLATPMTMKDGWSFWGQTIRLWLVLGQNLLFWSQDTCWLVSLPLGLDGLETSEAR